MLCMPNLIDNGFFIPHTMAKGVKILTSASLQDYCKLWFPHVNLSCKFKETGYCESVNYNDELEAIASAVKLLPLCPACPCSSSSPPPLPHISGSLLSWKNCLLTVTSSSYGEAKLSSLICSLFLAVILKTAIPPPTPSPPPLDFHHFLLSSSQKRSYGNCLPEKPVACILGIQKLLKSL